MARIELIQPESAGPDVKEIYETALRGKPGNAQKALAHRPEMLKAFLGLYASVGRSLERKLYELIYIRVSMINECRYCLQHHLAASKRAGVTPRRVGQAKIGRLQRFHAERTRGACLFGEGDAGAARNC